MYSDLYFQEKKSISVPKVFWLGLIAVSAFVSSQAFLWYSSVPTKASEISVKKLQTTNTSPTSFNVFLETEEPTSIYSIYGKSETELKNAVYSLADTPKNMVPKKYHIFSYENLDQNTKYFYQFISDRKLIEHSGKTVFNTTTKENSNFDKSSSKNPIYGKVTTPNGEGLAGAQIIISRQSATGNAAPSQEVFMTSTKESGEWLYSLPSSFIDTDIINIEIFHEKYSPSKVQAVVSKASPIPQTLIIGTDYVFSESENVLGVQNTSSANRNNDAYVISILYPEKNAIIPDSKPLFKGYGVPRTTVNIEVNSRPVFRAQAIVNSQGVWVFEPKNPFTHGTYTLTVKIQDTNGAIRSIIRNFVIAKSGEQVLGESTISTPSGTLAPTSRVTGTVTPSPTSGAQVLTPTQAPIVTIITATPFVTMPFGLSPSPTELQKAGGEFPMWLPVIGATFVFAGYLFVRQASEYTY